MRTKGIKRVRKRTYVFWLKKDKLYSRYFYNRNIKRKWIDINLRDKGYKYDKHQRYWTKGLDEIKKEMLEKFDYWAYANLKGYIKSRPKVMGKLEMADISDEGDDIYQLNANGTDEPKKFKIKLRYDKRNSTLELYLRDWYEEVRV